jgi:uncharacterized lipoprotein
VVVVMKQIGFLLAIVSITILLVGCSTSSREEYQGSESVPPIFLPGDLSSVKIKSYYVIPPLAKNAPKGKPSLVPPGAKHIG